jgi:hypothetical protein
VPRHIIIAATSKEVKTECNVVESSEEGYSSKMDVSPMKTKKAFGKL